MALRDDARPGDLYKKNGVLYRVIGYQPRPTVILEPIWPNPTPVRDRGYEVEAQETHALGCMNAEEFDYVGSME